MAVSKRILRNLIGVKLAQLELREPASAAPKSIFSVGTPGDPGGVRYFPYITEAEAYFFQQVRKIQEQGSPQSETCQLLDAYGVVPHRRRGTRAG